MSPKFKLGDKEYETNSLSDLGKANLASLNFTNLRLRELINMKNTLQLAKDSCMGNLKREVMSNKFGLFLGDD